MIAAIMIVIIIYTMIEVKRNFSNEDGVASKIGLCIEIVPWIDVPP
jgi:hypothetical protein